MYKFGTMHLTLINKLVVYLKEIVFVFLPLGLLVAINMYKSYD